VLFATFLTSPALYFIYRLFLHTTPGLRQPIAEPTATIITNISLPRQVSSSSLLFIIVFSFFSSVGLTRMELGDVRQSASLVTLASMFPSTCAFILGTTPRRCRCRRNALPALVRKSWRGGTAARFVSEVDRIGYAISNFWTRAVRRDAVLRNALTKAEELNDISFRVLYEVSLGTASTGCAPHWLRRPDGGRLCRCPCGSGEVCH
jgi:hypothetical protein